MNIGNNVDIEIEKKYWSCGKKEDYTIVKTVTDEEGDEIENETAGFALDYSSMSIIDDLDYDLLIKEGYDIPDDYWKESDLNSEYQEEFESELRNTLNGLNVEITDDDFDSLVYNNKPLPITSYINCISIEDAREMFNKK
jgi:hypothetical protein